MRRKLKNVTESTSTSMKECQRRLVGAPMEAITKKNDSTTQLAICAEIESIPMSRQRRVS